MALITAAQARLYVQISGTGEDTDLETLIGRVGKVIAGYLGYPPPSVGASPTLESTTHTLYLTGDGGRDLPLGLYPVTAITSVQDDPTRQHDGSSYLISSSNYAIQEGRALRLTHSSGLTWSSTRGGIKVVCTAGYTSIPEVIQEVCCEEVALRWRRRKQLGVTSSSSGGGSTSPAKPETLSAASKLALSPYRLVGAYL